MISFLRRMTKLFDVLRPIAWSAFSIFICFCVFQPFTLWLNPTYSLLANRGPGKIAFTLIIVAHLFILAAQRSKKEWQYFLKTNVLFITKTRWLEPFFATFTAFAALHVFMLMALTYTPYTTINIPSVWTTSDALPGIGFGFLATFFLAWTEEAIFRGTIIPILRTGGLSPLASILTSAAIFMLAHDITAPWHLVSSSLPLGIGLFLLGVLLAQLFILSDTLYLGMGAHAGLVFIKVVLRRLPCIAYSRTLPWWLHVDLRQSPLVHACFIILILVIFWLRKGAFFASRNNS
jgi:hypothetical protein